MLSPQQSKRVDLLNSGKHEKRVLAAPFQNTSQKQVHQTISPKNSNAHATVSSEHVDYRTHTFKPLDHPQMVKMHTYCGPTTESNWVIPGVLLVGAYPASEDDRETLDLITSILRLGIKKFVCLQLEYRHDVTPEMWRYGKSLRPYFEDVKAIVANKHKYPQLSNAPMPVVEPHHLSFAHCPIVDCGITDDDRVLDLCRQLVADISRGEVLYLHCWGGHGRTGTVVCIMLHLMYGLSAADAMARCQLVHDLRVCPVNVGSPQTQTQRDQVARIIGCLEDSHRLEKMKLSLQMHISAASISNNTNKPNGTSTGFSGEEDSSKTVVLAGGTASASSSSKIRTGGLTGHVHNNRLNSHNGNNNNSINNNNNSNISIESQIHASAVAEEPKPAAMKGPLASQISGKSSGTSGSSSSSSSVSNPVVQSVISERTTQQAPQPMGGPPQRNATHQTFGQHQHPVPQHQPSLHQQLVARKLSASNGSTTPTLRYSFVSDSNVVSVAAAVASSNTTALSDSRSSSFVARTSLRHLDQCLLGSAFDMSGNNSGAPSPSPPHPLLRSVSSDYGFNLYETTAALDIRRDSHTADAVLVHQDAGSAMVVESLTSTSTPLAAKNPVFFFAPPVDEQQPQQESSGSAEEMETTSPLPGEEQEEASRLSVVMTTEEDGATTDTTEETAVVGEGSESQSRPMSVSLEGTVGSETDNDSTPVDKPVVTIDTVRQSSVEAGSTGVNGKVGGIAERQWSTSSKDSGKSDGLPRQASGTGLNSSSAVRTNYATTPKNSSGNNSAGNGNNASTISQVLSVARQVLLGNSANNANSPSNAAASTSATNSLGSSANTSGKTTPVRMTPIPPSGHAPTAASTSQQLSTRRRIDRAGSGKR